MTDNGDNDTSVAYCAVGGVPGDGEIPMETVRSCPSAESPMKIMSVGMRKITDNTQNDKQNRDGRVHHYVAIPCTYKDINK